MAAESDVQDAWTDQDSEDLFVRGRAYVHFKHLLLGAQAQIPSLEREVARAHYESDITQRIRERMTAPEVRERWEGLASVAHDAVVLAEQRLAQAGEDAAYYSAMVAEIEADLGERAVIYEAMLSDFDWIDEEDWDEDWDEEDWEDDELDDEDWEEPEVAA